MNRDNRIKLKSAYTDFDREVRRAAYMFSNEIEQMKEEEEEKLDRLPSQLRDSSKGEQLDESISKLSDVLDRIDDIASSVDDIADALEAESKFIAPSIDKPATISPGRKGRSFHALFPESLLQALKDRSATSGLSMNEIVCRTLLKELSCNV